MFLSSSLADFEGKRPLARLDVLHDDLDVLVGKLADILKDEHQPANFVDELGSFLAEIVEQLALGGTVGDVEHLGDRGDAAGILEALAHHARHAALEPLFDLANDFRIGLAHRGDAADDGELPFGGQSGQDFRAKVGRQVGHDRARLSADVRR